LSLTALAIAGVSFAESVSVAKVYARRGKYALKPDRELIALGAANLVGSLFGGYPVAGGFSRTALNAQAGARTPVASLVTALVVAVTLVFLTPAFFYLPKAVLAAIIVTAVVGLIDLKEVQHLFKVKRTDLVLLLVTFFGTLAWGVVQGLVIGAAASLVWLVLATTRPHLAVLGRVPGTHVFRNIQRFSSLVTYRGVLAIRMDAQFYFGNVAYLRETLAKLEREAHEPISSIILDASSISRLDSSGEAALSEMLDEYQERSVALYICGAIGPVRDVLERSGLLDKLGNRGRCLSVHEAVFMTGAAAEHEKSSAVLPKVRASREASRYSARL
jgi:SulP family sulfate permease